MTQKRQQYDPICSSLETKKNEVVEHGSFGASLTLKSYFENPILRQVCFGFSGFDSLKIVLVIQLMTKNEAVNILVRRPH